MLIYLSYAPLGYGESGRLLTFIGRFDASDRVLNDALELSIREGIIQTECVVMSFYALHFLMMARQQAINSQPSINSVKLGIEAAEHALMLADKQAKDYPVLRDYNRVYWLLGAVYRASGDLYKAEENLSKAINMCRQTNNVENEADILLEIARLRYDKKYYEEAKSLADEALSITERSGYVLQGADVNLFLAQYALEQEKDKVKAKGNAEQAKILATCDGPPYYYKVAYQEAERFLEKLNT